MAQNIPYPHIDFLLPRAVSRNVPQATLNPAEYVQLPGQQFERPYLAIPGGRAFVWPLPVDGFSVRSSPSIGIHKYIGTNQLEVDVTHRGERHVTLSGIFMGDRTTGMIADLLDICERETPAPGKILYLPGIFAHAQFVAVEDVTCSHPQGEWFEEASYDISFIRTGTGDLIQETALTLPIETPIITLRPRGKSARAVVSTKKLNTLRKIAAAKLGDRGEWRRLYNKNTKVFVKLHVALNAAPDHRLPLGTRIYY